MADTAEVWATLEVGGTEYRVIRLELHEAIFAVPELSATITDDQGGAPPPADLLGKDLVLTLVAAKFVDSTRTFAGHVTMARRADDALGRIHLEIKASPHVWRLNKRKDCRIYQEMKAIDIAKDVLERGGVQNVSDSLTRDYEDRTYVAQYRETDLAFVERILAEEGIYYVCQSVDGEAKLLLSDDPRGLGEVAGETTIAFEDGFGFELHRPCVRRVTQTQEVRSDKVHLRHYDFEYPRFTVEAKSEGTDPGEKALEVYEYAARFTDDAIGQQRAEDLVTSIQADRHRIEGDTTVLHLEAGHRFTMEGHPYAPLNQELLLLSTTIAYAPPRGVHGDESEEANFVCRFVAIPTQTSPYKPPRKPRAAQVVGLQSALVTGPSGTEIHSDEHGRVKAWARWDRENPKDDTASHWLRTAQAATGESVLLPRVGWEVFTQMDEGDPDTPLVMSRAYNAETPPPYALPDHKARSSVQTATTPGGGSTNELRMDDSGGQEEMFFNASKDMSIDVLNNTTESVGNNETLSVGGNRVVNITNSNDHTVGASQTLDVGGNQSISAETAKVDEVAGDIELTIGGNRDMKVGGDHKRSVGADSTITVGGMHTDIVVGSINESCGANMSIDVGAARVSMTAADYGTLVGGMHSETVGALKAIVAFGGRGVDISGALTQQVGGAILNKIDADRADSAGGMFTEVAAGASIIKADNITYEADGMLSVVMGASTLILTPASVMIAGVSVKLDGKVKETAALVLDN